MDESIKLFLFNIYKDKKFFEILRDRGLSNLGDNFANFVYSLAKSKTLKKASGWKVSGKTLAIALQDSNLRKLCPSRASTHDLADFAESIIIYLWFSSDFTMEEIVNILSEEMNDGTFSDLKKEERTASKAFTTLFIKFKEKLREKGLIQY
ncbi:MAG: ribonuclease III family protein [Candidatus Helarchaeota archaeon]